MSDKNMDMKSKMNKKLNDLKEFARRNKESESYKRYEKRDIIRSSVSIIIVELVFYKIMMQQEKKLPIYIGLFLMSLLFSGYAVYKHKKEEKDSKKSEVIHNTFILFHSLIIFTFLVSMLELIF